MTVAVPRPRSQAGWSMIEICVVVAIIAIVAAAGLPQFGVMLANSRVRATAQTLQDGLAIAQAEALRRSAPVETIVTGNDPATTSASPSSPATAWSVRVPANLVLGIPNPILVRSSPADPGTTAAQIENRAGANIGVVFSQNGRVLQNNGGVYSQPPGNLVFRITALNADRPLCVYVTVAGSIKSCDPKLASTDSRACSTTLTTPIDCPAS